MLKAPWRTTSLQTYTTDISASVIMLGMASKKRDIEDGVQIHAEMLKLGALDSRSSVLTALIHMYANCGALAKAQALVVGLLPQDTIAWTVLISTCIQSGRPEDAVDFFVRMQYEGASPDVVTFACALKACGSIGAVDKGREIHEKIVEHGLLKSDVVLGTALIDMYCKCGALLQAQRVLERLCKRDVICWNALISGYAQHGKGQDALRFLEMMQNEGLSPSVVTFTSALQACGSIQATEQGIKIHDRIVREGLLSKHVVLGTALIDMYGKCGALARAHQVLEELSVIDVTSWSALIASYAQHGKGEYALICFDRMQQEGLLANALTLVCLSKACGSIGSGNNGQQIHNEIIKQGLSENNIMVGNALVSMYAKCGNLAKAQQLFEDLPARNIVSWSGLIAGYVEQGEGNNALDTWKKMQLEGFSPNAVTFTSILKACSIIGCIEKGAQIHEEITKHGYLACDNVLGGALVDMYAKCGALDRAQRVLKKLPAADVISWSALLAGHAQKGSGIEALDCFRQMQHRGILPDAVTFTSVLNSCSLAGFLGVCQNVFMHLGSEFGIRPELEHYTCMIDAFRKTGRLDDAFAITSHLPTFSDSVVQIALLDSSIQWGNIGAANLVFERSNQWQ